jgi:hypothetical protein
MEGPNKKHCPPKEEDVITVRFIDKKYKIPYNTLMSIDYFALALAGETLAQLQPQEDGSYYIPELALDRFDKLLPRVDPGYYKAKGETNSVEKGKLRNGIFGQYPMHHTTGFILARLLVVTNANDVVMLERQNLILSQNIYDALEGESTVTIASDKPNLPYSSTTLYFHDDNTVLITMSRN